MRTTNAQDGLQPGLLCPICGFAVPGSCDSAPSGARGHGSADIKKLRVVVQSLAERKKSFPVPT